MNPFDKIASGYDRALLPMELVALRKLRKLAFSEIGGRVLELGVGTGVNLPLYSADARVVALDASREMIDHAGRRETRAAVRLIQSDAQHLPFASGSFDTVTGSLLFCSVEDPDKALAEVHRVIRDSAPGTDRPPGRLVLIEHMRGEGLGAWLTDLVNPLWAAVSKSCNLNRETIRSVTRAGFELTRVEKRGLGILRLIEGVK